MALTLADIEIWDVAAIDQVFAAAMSRAEGAQNTGNTVGDLLSFIPWDGRAADAARDSAHLIKVTLNDHGDQCRRVAEAAKKASAEVADLKYRLSKIKGDAAEAFLRIDDQTGAVSPKTAVLTASQLQQQKAVMQDLVARIKQLLADADNADRDLATAIQTADGAATTPADPAGGQPPRPLAKPPPDSASPADRKKWWDGLTPQQQVDLLSQDPAAIDKEGIPADIRDAANRIRLPHELAVAKTTLDTARGNESRYWEYVNTHHGDAPPGMTGDPVAALANAESRYNDLIGIQSAMYPTNPDGTPRKIDPSDRRSLVTLDPASNPRHVFGAIGIGDVDRAAHVGVTTGGVATNAGSLPGMVDEATNLRHTTAEILTHAGDPNPGSVATIAWVGYEPPADLSDMRVLGDGLARDAAPRLNGFFNGLAATTQNPHQEITAFGHSYGSLVTSLALQQGSPVKNVVFYGSPGLELGQPGDLHLAPGGHAYYEQADADPIVWVQRGPAILDAVPIIGPELNLLLGSGDTGERFGETPNQMPGISQLSTSAGVDPVLGEQRAGASGHAEYPRDDGTANHNLRMSGYNLAAVLSGIQGATKTGN
ncbi:alpha/beta hydrolase [Mycobacterium sp. 050128]|uniref:alpha/beta hydrolase n=1 Tax=Mycobacterium sp. 050128 TaxID=3096112 RepID=UPI002ED86100